MKSIQIKALKTPQNTNSLQEAEAISSTLQTADFCLPLLK